MNCTWCGYENQANARYCGNCGRSFHLGQVCASCGVENPAENWFCDACGLRLSGTVLPESVTSTLTQALPTQEFASQAGAIAQPRTSRLSLPISPGVLTATGAVLAVIGQLVLLRARNGDSPPAGGTILLGLSLGFFALGAFVTSVSGSAVKLSDSIAPPWVVFRGYWKVLTTGLGVLTMLLLLLRVADGSSEGWDLVLMFSAAILLGAPFLTQLRLPRLTFASSTLKDLLVVSLLMGLFMALNVRDLGSWYYSAIGDEYAFYGAALDIAENGIERPLSQDGVYGQHPVLNSGYQALVMTIFGRDNFGWRFASVLSVVLTIPGVYLVGLVLRDRKTAMVSAILFASSYYLFAYAHTGYNTIHSLAPTVWAVALFVLGQRKGSAGLLFASGIVAGLGFYTYFAARAALPIIALFVLTQARRKRRMLDTWPLLLGFAVVTAPFLATNRGEVWSAMLAQVPGGYSSDIAGPPLQRILSNLSTNLPAFNYNHHIIHYVSGALLDPITAVLAVLGTGLALGQLRQTSYRLLLIWLVVAFAATGLLSPYSHVVVTRLSFMVPPLALLAGCAAVHILDRIDVSLAKGLHRWAWTGVTISLALAVLGLNVRQFWYETPKVFHHTQEAVAIGAMRSQACGGTPDQAVFIGKGLEALLKPALLSYYPDVAQFRLVNQETLGSEREIDATSTRCIIFMYPHDAKSQQLLDGLNERYPEATVVDFGDPSGKARVKILSLVTGS